MDARAAVAQAKEYVSILFADEGISDVYLEEIFFGQEDTEEWKVTIGFNRSSSRERARNPVVEAISPPREREYKVVVINDLDGRIVSVTDRFFPESD